MSSLCTHSFSDFSALPLVYCAGLNPVLQPLDSTAPVKDISNEIDDALSVNPDALKDSIQLLSNKIQGTDGTLEEFLDEGLFENVFNVLNDREMDANTRYAATEFLLALYTHRTSRKWALGLATRKPSVQSEFQTLARGLTSISSFDCQVVAMDLLGVHFNSLKKHAQQQSALRSALPHPIADAFASSGGGDTAALRAGNHADASSRVRFLGVSDARIALISPGGGGIDSICSHVVNIPLPNEGGKQTNNSGVGSSLPPFLVIDPRCITLDLANEDGDEAFVPSLKVQWKSMEDPNKDTFIHYKSKSTVEVRFRTSLGLVEGLAESPSAVKAWGFKKTNSMGGASQEYLKRGGAEGTSVIKSNPFFGDQRRCEVALRLTIASQAREAEGWAEAALDSYEEWRRTGVEGCSSGISLNHKTSVASLGSVAALHHVAAKLEDPASRKKTITLMEGENSSDEASSSDGSDERDDLSSDESSEEEESLEEHSCKQKDCPPAEARSVLSSAASKDKPARSSTRSSSALLSSTRDTSIDVNSNDEETVEDVPLVQKKELTAADSSTSPSGTSTRTTRSRGAAKEGKAVTNVNNGNKSENDPSPLSQGLSTGFDLSDEEDLHTLSKSKEKDPPLGRARAISSLSKNSTLKDSIKSKHDSRSKPREEVAAAKSMESPSQKSDQGSDSLSSQPVSDAYPSNSPLCKKSALSRKGMAKKSTFDFEESDEDQELCCSGSRRCGKGEEKTKAEKGVEGKGKGLGAARGAMKSAALASNQTKAQPELLRFGRISKKDKAPKELLPNKPASDTGATEAKAKTSENSSHASAKSKSSPAPTTEGRPPKFPLCKIKVPNGKVKEMAISRANKKQVAVLKKLLVRFGLESKTKGKKKRLELATLVVESGYYDHENDQYPDKASEWPDSDDSDLEDEGERKIDVRVDQSSLEDRTAVKNAPYARSSPPVTSPLKKITALSKKSAFDFDESDEEDEDQKNGSHPPKVKSAQSKTSIPAPTKTENEMTRPVVHQYKRKKDNEGPKLDSKCVGNSFARKEDPSLKGSTDAPQKILKLDSKYDGSSGARKEGFIGEGAAGAQKEPLPLVPVPISKRSSSSMSGSASECLVSNISTARGASTKHAVISGLAKGASKTGSGNKRGRTPAKAEESPEASADENTSEGEADALGLTGGLPSDEDGNESSSASSQNSTDCHRNSTKTSSNVVTVDTKTSVTTNGSSFSPPVGKRLPLSSSKKTTSPLPQAPSVAAAVTAVKPASAATAVTVSAGRRAEAKHTQDTTSGMNRVSAATSATSSNKATKMRTKSARARMISNDHPVGPEEYTNDKRAEDEDEDEVPSPDSFTSKWPSFSSAVSTAKVQDECDDEEEEDHNSESDEDSGDDPYSTQEDFEEDGPSPTKKCRSSEPRRGAKGGSRRNQDDSDDDSEDSDDSDSTDNTLMILMSSMAKLAEEKDNRQKKKLIERSRAEDVHAVETGLTTWREHLENTKTEKQQALASEIHAEMEKVEAIALEINAQLEVWNTTVSQHQESTNKRCAEFDEIREEIDSLAVQAEKEDSALKKKLRTKAKHSLDEFTAQAKKSHSKKSKDKDKAANAIKMKFS